MYSGTCFYSLQGLVSEDQSPVFASRRSSKSSSRIQCPVGERNRKSGSVDLATEAGAKVFKPRARPERRLAKAAYLSHHAIVIILVIVIVVSVDTI